MEIGRGLMRLMTGQLTGGMLLSFSFFFPVFHCPCFVIGTSPSRSRFSSGKKTLFLSEREWMLVLVVVKRFMFVLVQYITGVEYRELRAIRVVTSTTLAESSLNQVSHFQAPEVDTHYARLYWFAEVLHLSSSALQITPTKCALDPHLQQYFSYYVIFMRPSHRKDGPAYPKPGKYSFSSLFVSTTNWLTCSSDFAAPLTPSPPCSRAACCSRSWPGLYG